jgi:hypothetical protein
MRVDSRQELCARPKTSGLRLVSCFKSPMEKSETLYLRSNFGVQECLRRIREATDAPKLQFFFPFGYGGSKPVFAALRGSRIKLWKRRERRNDFAPCFFGVFSSEGSGSRLTGRFRMDRGVRLLIAFWLTADPWVCTGPLKTALSSDASSFSLGAQRDSALINAQIGN